MMPLLVAILFCSFTLASALPTSQARDHLTTQEEELIRDAQILDQRIEIFIKAAERRWLALNGVDEVAAKQIKKDAEKWGELPAGSRAELVRDLAKILDEAITNIDDVSSHDERNPLIPKALRRLAAVTNVLINRLKPLHAQAKSESELASFEDLFENAESILEAANKLPPPTDNKEKAKSKSN